MKGTRIQCDDGTRETTRRRILAARDLVSVCSGNRTHFPGEITQSCYGTSCVLEVHEIKEVKNFEELYLSKFAYVFAEENDRLDQLLSAVINVHCKSCK